MGKIGISCEMSMEFFIYDPKEWINSYNRLKI